MIHSSRLLPLAIMMMATSAGRATDISVIDGGSLLYHGQKVGIWGISAPSIDETCTTSAGRVWPCGERAFHNLAEVAADETFACQDKKPGFVICHAGGLDIGLLLVKEGLARAGDGYSDVEASARQARIGLWE